MRVRESGGRASNAWASYPLVGDNVWKRTLIPDKLRNRMVPVGKAGIRKDLPQVEAPACHQLVGEVMAHQG